MKILVVHETDYLHKPFIEFQEFAEGLSAKGHQVSVLHVQEFPKGSAEKMPAVTKMPGLQISNSKMMIYSPWFVTRGIISRTLLVFEHLRLLTQIFFTNKPDVVLSYSVPTSGVTVALFGKLFGVPVLHRAIDVSHLLRSRVLSPLVRLSEILTFSLSSAVSTHNGALKNYIHNSIKTSKDVSIEYPPVFPIQKTEAAEKPESDGVRLLFIGTLAHFTDLEAVFHSLSKSDANNKVKLRIVGAGDKEHILQELLKALDLENTVEFRGWRKKEDFPAELAWADIGIVPFHKNLLTDCALPQKAIEYLSFGLPVVSTRLDGAESVLGDNPDMHFVDHSSEIVSECQRVFSATNKSSAKPLTEFSREKTLEAMEARLIKLLADGKK